MKRFTLLVSVLALITLFNCSENDPEDIFGPGVGSGNGNSNAIKTYTTNSSITDIGTINSVLEFDDSGNLLTTTLNSNLTLPIFGQINTTTNTTYERDSQGRITMYNSQFSSLGETGNIQHVVEYNDNNEVTQITENGVDENNASYNRVSTFTYSGTTVTGEQRNSADEVVGRLTVTNFSPTSLVTNITYEHIPSNTTYEERITVTSGNAVKVESFENNTSTDVIEYSYDENPNPLSKFTINANDVNLGILQAFAATNFQEDPFDLSSVDSGAALYSTNNFSSVISEGETAELNYSFNSNNLPTESSYSNAQASVQNTYTYH